MSGITANNASKAFPNFESDVSKLRRDDQKRNKTRDAQQPLASIVARHDSDQSNPEETGLQANSPSPISLGESLQTGTMLLRLSQPESEIELEESKDVRRGDNEEHNDFEQEAKQFDEDLEKLMTY